jgi:histidine triad (HIT) family protein
MPDCIFCLQQDGDSVVYKDEKCYVMLDKYPVSRGHLLVISRDHYETVLDAPRDVSGHAFLLADHFAKVVKEEMEADGVNVTANIGKAAGQVVMHMHIHIIPRYLNQARNYNFGTGKEIDESVKQDLMTRLSARTHRPPSDL